ncbi:MULTISPECIES: chemotaxis protein [Bacillus cereus group]|uniref:chemotaxis protein n=1 Tax=Bacillus cereus group TaxID=86661 RepID=UPI0022E7B2B7|nr:chemotaxis protein [Bacillus cereus group sp. TH152-1LC]MDA1674491.1 chemotaxis protein [Bacillus cereus group sp. TH152-1LC]
MSEEKKGILLDSGTNELEIVTYTVGKNLFSINVMKVREIIHPSYVTPIPESHPAVEGVLQVRGEIIPVINLAKALGIQSTTAPEDSKFIIAELNQMKVVFRVDEVHRIQRISWKQIEEPSSLSMGLEDTTSGIVKLDEKLILMLDYEKLVYDISPSTNMSIKDIETSSDKNLERSDKVIYVAEDSAMLRQLLEDTLRASGYNNLTFFKNGEEALIHIESISKVNKITDVVHLLITDIEMPKMDGHHLTKQIKDNPNTQQLPVVIFSSLISNELRHKGDVVGANAQVSKPEIKTLINAIDNLLLV